MKRYILAIFILSVFTTYGFAQDQKTPAGPQDATQSQGPATPTVAPTTDATQPQEVSIYGEVKAANAATNTVTIQYYDYDSDEEKTIDIVADKDTKMENAASVADIKQGNWADVIYTVSSGKNMAKSIIIEKDEEAPVEAPAVTEEKPVANQEPAAPKQ